MYFIYAVKTNYKSLFTKFCVISSGQDWLAGIFQLLPRWHNSGHHSSGLPLSAGQVAAGRTGEMSETGDQPSHDRHAELFRSELCLHFLQLYQTSIIYRIDSEFPSSHNDLSLSLSLTC